MYGGHPPRKGPLYAMLANPLYAGRIRASGEIVTQETFDLVQQRLKANTRKAAWDIVRSARWQLERTRESSGKPGSFRRRKSCPRS